MATNLQKQQAAIIYANLCNTVFNSKTVDFHQINDKIIVLIQCFYIKHGERLEIADMWEMTEIIDIADSIMTTDPITLNKGLDSVMNMMVDNIVRNRWKERTRAKTGYNGDSEWLHEDHPVDWFVDIVQKDLEVAIRRDLNDSEHQELYEFIEAGLN